MKAVVYQGKKGLRVEDVAEPVIEYPTDALIKVTTSAICASDLHVIEGEGIKPGVAEPGMIMGHEYCGVVVDTGNQVSCLENGDRVVGRPVASCGHCYYCIRHQEALCEYGALFGKVKKQGSISGTQAEYARVPFADNTLTRIPDGLVDEDVVFTGDILSTGYSGVLRSNVGMGDTVAVFGCGPVGLCAVACAPLFGAGLVIAVDVLDYRLEAARKFGAVTINASREEPTAKIMGLTDGRGADAGVEAAGFEATLNACFKAIRRGGSVCVLGTVPHPYHFDLSERFFDMFNLNIGLGDQNHVEALIRLIQRGKLDLRPLITHTFPLTEALRGYEIFEKKLEGCIKVLLQP